MRPPAKLEVRTFRQRHAGSRGSVDGFIIGSPKSSNGGSFVLARNDGPLVGWEVEAARAMCEAWNATAANAIRRARLREVGS